MNVANDPEAARQVEIVEAATGIFLRYGFKKTAMEDIARAVGISRQALYLYFPTKEAVFKAVISRSLAAMRTEARAALAHQDHDIEERVLGAFEALHSKAVGVEHLGELIATTATLTGPVFREMEQAVVRDMAQALDTAGVAARWTRAGVSPMELAQHLAATSEGIKFSAKTLEEYLDRMRIAVRIVCWGALPEANARSGRAP